MNNKELEHAVLVMGNQIYQLRDEREETDKALSFVLDSWWETVKEIQHLLLELKPEKDGK